MKRLLGRVAVALGVAEIVLPQAAQQAVHGALEMWAGQQASPRSARALTD